MWDSYLYTLYKVTIFQQMMDFYKPVMGGCYYNTREEIDHGKTDIS